MTRIEAKTDNHRYVFLRVSTLYAENLTKNQQDSLVDVFKTIRLLSSRNPFGISEVIDINLNMEV